MGRIFVLLLTFTTAVAFASENKKDFTCFVGSAMSNYQTKFIFDNERSRIHVEVRSQIYTSNKLVFENDFSATELHGDANLFVAWGLKAEDHKNFLIAKKMTEDRWQVRVDLAQPTTSTDDLFYVANTIYFQCQ